MTATDAPEPIYLPPLFTLREVGQRDPFEAAVARAGEAETEAGALFLGERDGILAWAVVLVPEEPLATARRALFVGIAAAADALAALCLPERSVRIGWPDVLVYDAGRIGGGRIAWPDGCDETSVPDWLVFGVELIANRDGLTEPGRHPDTTSLKEEHFESGREIVESFARNLMLRLDLRDRNGADAAEADYLKRLLPEGDAAFRIAPNGDLLVREGDGAVRVRSLLKGLAAAAWRDPARGGPRL